MPLVRAAGNWWARGAPVMYDDLTGISNAMLDASVVTSDKIAANAVVSDALSAKAVLSEKLSSNALRRSVVIALPDLGAGTTSPLTSANTVFVPSLPILVAGVSLTALTSWVQTTLQTTPVGTLYAGNNVVGTVNIPTTNAPLRGTTLTFVGLANLSVPAGTVLSFGLPTATSAGMDAPGHLLQIDYDSTG